MAVSDDLKGLLVPARTEKELEQKIPAAITEILEAQGKQVFNVTAAPDTSNELGEFAPPAFIASACLANV
jgi:hypothetical protein